jgi:hypothetical protein
MPSAKVMSSVPTFCESWTPFRDSHRAKDQALADTYRATLTVLVSDHLPVQVWIPLTLGLHGVPVLRFSRV